MVRIEPRNQIAEGVYDLDRRVELVSRRVSVISADELNGILTLGALMLFFLALLLIFLYIAYKKTIPR